MNNIKTQYGLIGFFDILGYQKLLENNGVDVVTKEVLEILLNLDKHIPKEIVDVFVSVINKQKIKNAEAGTNYIKELISKVNWLIFSDTILLTCDFDSNAPFPENIFKCFGFLSAVRLLNSSMYFIGLPLRGVITCGEFIVVDNCIAGKPIIEAYKKTNELDLMVCAIEPHAYKLIIDTFNSLESDLKPNSDSEIFKNSFVSYSIPMNNDKQEKMYTLNYLNKHQELLSMCTNEIKQEVINVFKKYNKEVSHKVYKKVENTVQYLQYLIHNMK